MLWPRSLCKVVVASGFLSLTSLSPGTVCSRESKISVWLNQVHRGLRTLRKHRSLRNLQTEKGWTDPDEPPRKVKCLAHVHIMCTSIELFQPRSPNPGSQAWERVRLLALWLQTVCRMAWWNQVVTCCSCLSFTPKLQLCGFFFHYIPSSPSSWTAFS